jgi:hypothetical protein
MAAGRDQSAGMTLPADCLELCLAVVGQRLKALLNSQIVLRSVDANAD